MTAQLTKNYTAFNRQHRLASGPLLAVAQTVKATLDRDAAASILVFDDATGRPMDLDLRGSAEALAARYAESTDTQTAETDAVATIDQEDATLLREEGKRGRPKLGVVAREVTLLPRHWQWLASQPGGASVALRKLVEEARRTHSVQDARRQAQERTYHFMLAIAGDQPHFEEATRALYANDRERFIEQMAMWPNDVREHAVALAFANDEQSGECHEKRCI